MLLFNMDDFLSQETLNRSIQIPIVASTTTVKKKKRKKSFEGI